MKLSGLRYRYPGPHGFELGPLETAGPDDRPWLILGGNGAGKSTLLRLLGGALRPASGRVEGVAAGADTGYLPQRAEAALAGRNLAEDLSGEVRPRTALRSELRRALAAVGLAGVPLSRRSRRLSAGERRRVAIALLVLSGRPHWALDEPEAGLDAAGRARLLEILAERLRAGRGRLWLATHRFELYAHLRPWALVLEGGRLEAVGNLGDVLGVKETAALLGLPNRPPAATWAKLAKWLPGSHFSLSAPPPPGLRASQVHELLADRAGLT